MDARKVIVEWMEPRRQELVDLLSALIAARTENPPGNESAAAAELGAFFKRYDIPFEEFAAEPERVNLIGRVGSGGKTLLLPGHLDTVPAGDGWTHPPFAARILDGRMYGRGASDDKGPTAALALAGACLKQCFQLNGTVLLAGVADEELGSALGLEYLLQEGKLAADFAIVPDVAGNMKTIDMAEKGLLFVEIVSHGRQAHGSTPEQGVNALWNLIGVLNRIRERGVPAAHHALIIDAMKELYRGYADAICLVSGDGDFTRLAQAWREEGKSVLAYGPAHTPVALRSACTEFGLLGQEKVYQQVCAKATIVQGVECITGDKVILKELLSIVEGMTERTETATVGNLSTLVRKRNPGFSPGRYRARTLTKLLRRLEAFELDALENQNGEISDYKVRIRPALARAKVHNPVRLASEGGGGDDAVGLQFLGAEGVVTLEIERDASQYAVRS